jgi:hypothetical protein
VFLFPDRTEKEQAEHRDLFLKLKEKSVADPNKRHWIKADVVSAELISSNVQTG